MPTDRLRQTCDPALFSAHSTADMEPLAGVLGQERAVRSIEFGLDISSSGFNLFIAGEPGTGRTTILMDILRRRAQTLPTPDDVVFVHNFENPDTPRVMRLPPKQGARFVRRMSETVDELQKQIARALESKEYREQARVSSERNQELKKQRLDALTQAAATDSVDIKATPEGFQPIPLDRSGKPFTEVAYKQLDDAGRKALQERLEKVQGLIREFVAEVKQIDRSHKAELKALDRRVVTAVLEDVLLDLRQEFAAHSDVLRYLDAVESDVLDHLDDFRQTEPPVAVVPGLTLPTREPDLTRYSVNLVVDNSSVEGAPVVLETNPTYGNLVGRIERRAQLGTLVTDFTMIRAGALAKANGGFLVVDVEDLLGAPHSYQALKHVLKDRVLAIEDLGERLGLLATQSLRPQPIHLDLKICLTGKPLYYHALFAQDADFRASFKVKADFDSDTERSDEAIRGFGSLVARLVNEEGLLPFDRTALAALVDESSRLVEDQNKLSLAFGQINDLVREVGYWAKKDGGDHAAAADVERAVKERDFRSSLASERVQELIERDVLMVDTSTATVGQINGLAVHQLGDYRFGRPSRITASVRVGTEGVINIERRVSLSHSSHDKGVLILVGFVGARFAMERPLALSASITFEQSYGEIAGDSASTTELYVLLSALSGLPIRQGVAVTGSVNQRGEVQAIGGVNHKIEGFFDLCAARGLTGDQGVLIPVQNVQHLMLRRDVVDAVKAGQFSVWAIDHVDRGMEVLTGVEAGVQDDGGNWTPGSVNDLVARRFRDLSDRLLGASGAESHSGPDIILPSDVGWVDAPPPTPPGPPPA